MDGVTSPAEYRWSPAMVAGAVHYSTLLSLMALSHRQFSLPVACVQAAIGAAPLRRKSS